MSTATKPVTAEELLQMSGDGVRRELVRGELRTMSPSGGQHGAIGMNLGAPLTQHVRSRDLGVVFGAETGFLVGRDPDTVRAPDLAFVPKKHIPAGGVPVSFWDGAPDLVVEVVSPSDRVNEVDEKVRDWLDAGTRLVWVVNPRPRTVTVYRADVKPSVLIEGDTLDGADVVPGFRLPVAEIFA